AKVPRAIFFSFKLRLQKRCEGDLNADHLKRRRRHAPAGKRYMASKVSPPLTKNRGSASLLLDAGFNSGAAVETSTDDDGDGTCDSYYVGLLIGGLDDDELPLDM